MKEYTENQDFSGDPSFLHSLKAIVRFLEQRSYVFAHLDLGCFMVFPNPSMAGQAKNQSRSIEVHFYLHRNHLPLLYQHHPTSCAVVVLTPNQKRTLVLPWTESDSYYDDITYVTDALNRLVDHYRLHSQAYHPASESAFKGITENCSYYFLFSPPREPISDPKTPHR